MIFQLKTRPHAALMAIAGLVWGSSIPTYAACSYDKQEAVTYAERYVNSPNPAYAWYPGSDESGNDCANFVSQCLIAGGLNIEEQATANGQSTYLAGDPGFKTIPHVDYLNAFLQGDGYLPGYAAGTGDIEVWAGSDTHAPNALQIGDPITFGYSVNGGSVMHWFHSVIVVSIVRDLDNITWPANVTVDCHSTEGDLHDYHTPLDVFWSNSSNWYHADFFHIIRTGDENNSVCPGNTTNPCPAPPCCGKSLQKIVAPTEIE